MFTNDEPQKVTNIYIGGVWVVSQVDNPINTMR